MSFFQNLASNHVKALGLRLLLWKDETQNPPSQEVEKNKEHIGLINEDI